MEKRLNSNHLKFLAIIAMTLDHSIDLFFPGFPSNPIAICFHIIGRLTAPIMWFFISEGYFYTRNPKKYLLRLFIFAIVSFFCVNKVYGLIQPFVILVYPLLKMYNGERGKLNTKWLFYIYYPLHLFIIGIFRILIYGNISLLF